MIPSFILSFNVDSSLKDVGGKGMNLARLYQAGFAVPPGFIISTAAYEWFVQTSGLSATIMDEVQDIKPDDIATLEKVSESIRTRFSSQPLPDSLVEELVDAYKALDHPAVAIRSSATIEDLPGVSAAGQQETYLNVIGEIALQKAIIDCWSSLWTARAIGYRERNGIDQASVSLALVVQKMVPSDCSGVLFTSNPLTGKRSEVVIDAIYGLGEALVSGQVEPDHYVVDADGYILSKTIGTKAISIREREGGGTVTIYEHSGHRHQVLTEEMITSLYELGHRATTLFGEPQDIEWAGKDGQLYLLQSRPITTLYPLPERMSAIPLKVMFSFGAVQGLLDPITPLGRDMICKAFIGGAKLFGYQLKMNSQQVLLEAGERLWGNMSGLINNLLGRKVTLFALEYVEPGAKQALIDLLRDGSLPPPGKPRLTTFMHLIRILLPAAGRALRTLIRPERQRDRLLNDMETWLRRWRVAMANSKSL
jgi:phosphoenolpyruvate synthase/pyruvate phosphate dikinase